MSQVLHSNVSNAILLCLSIYVVTATESSQTHFILLLYQFIMRYSSISFVRLIRQKKRPADREIISRPCSFRFYKIRIIIDL